MSNNGFLTAPPIAPPTEAPPIQASPTGVENLSLETLTILVNADRLKTLANEMTKKMTELKEVQDKVAFLHKVIKTINVSLVKGELDLSSNQELRTLLAEAKEYGIQINLEKMKYDKEEKENLISNIRMTVDDLTVIGDMLLQTLTRLMNERYESYQLARSILKPSHDDKINKARAIAGR